MGGGVCFSAALELFFPRSGLYSPAPRASPLSTAAETWARTVVLSILMLSDLASAFGHRLGESDCRTLPDTANGPVLKPLQLPYFSGT